MDDPLTILREAGIECPEVEALHWGCGDAPFEVDEFREKADLDATTILALARLAAKYKWQRDEDIRLSVTTDWNREGLSETDFVAAETAWIEARWEARDE